MSKGCTCNATWEPPCYPTAPTPWNTFPATSTVSFSEEWKPVLHLEFSKLTQAAAQKPSQDWAGRNTQSSLHPIRSLAEVSKAENSLVWTAQLNPSDTWLLESSLPHRTALSPSLLQMAAGIPVPKKSDFTGNLGNPGRLGGSASSSLTPVSGCSQHSPEGNDCQAQLELWAVLYKNKECLKPVSDHGLHFEPPAIHLKLQREILLHSK